MRERKPGKRLNRWWLPLGLACAAALGPDAVYAQLKTTAPGSAGDPVWQRTLHLSDGRTFVTDGGIAIDAALAKPASLPTPALPDASAKTIEKYLAATLKDEFSVSELTANPNGRTYASPSGLLLNSTYVNFLRRVLPNRTLRFRMETELTPMVIMSDGKAVGVLMGVKK
jgi:hypothetical protein